MVVVRQPLKECSFGGERRVLQDGVPSIVRMLCPQSARTPEVVILIQTATSGQLLLVHSVWPGPLRKEWIPTWSELVMLLGNHFATFGRRKEETVAL